jgi:hypothetical protein
MENTGSKHFFFRKKTSKTTRMSLAHGCDNAYGPDTEKAGK